PAPHHDPRGLPTTATPSPWRSRRPEPTGGPDPTRTDQRTTRRGTDAADARPTTRTPTRPAPDARPALPRPTTPGSDQTSPAHPPFFSIRTENASTLDRLLSSLLAVPTRFSPESHGCRLSAGLSPTCGQVGVTP